MTCPHENFAANVEVNRLSKGEGGAIESYSCDVTVKCHDCGMPFRFCIDDVGLQHGKVMVAPNGQELRVYVEPSDGSLQGKAKPPGFRIQATAPPPKHSEN